MFGFRRYLHPADKVVQNLNIEIESDDDIFHHIVKGRGLYTVRRTGD